ncbi:MAG TPA: outer membrane beta-barrel domain-containing protein [Polyangia bacterium]|jgi:outer membrane beta-barrel protein|nr:outer membrane beta-barrel domain-containing protein [Polyangia bacterium]
MKRPAICLLVWVALLGWAAPGYAKKGGKAAAPATDTSDVADDGAKTTTTDTSAAGDSATDDKGKADAAGGKEAAAPGESLETDETQPGKVEEEVGGGQKAARPPSSGSWADIVVVPRKAFIKTLRLELQPFTGVTVNDNLIRHFVFGADLNFFLSDVIWIGLQGQYFIHQLTNQEELLGSEYNRAPTLNQYLYGGSFNFGYAPIYGKFALFNRSILSWEIWATGGIGATFTEVIPRDPANNSLAFKNTDLTVNVGIGSRFFLTDWLTVNFALRDYIIADHFEPLPDGTLAMPAITTSAEAKDRAQSEWVQNLVFYVGVGFYLPTKFQYKTPR